MAVYPSRGLTPWDVELKAYVDDEDAAAEAAAATYTDSQIATVNSSLADKQDIATLDVDTAALASDDLSALNDAIEALIPPAEASVFIFPEDHGAVGDGVTDDLAAINAAIDAANLAGGGTVLASAMYAFDGEIQHKSDVTVLGLGGGDLQTTVGFKALSATSRYRYGLGQGGGSPRPGPLLRVRIDGNGTGDPAGLLLVQSVQGHLESLRVTNGAGHGVVYDAAQNNTMLSCRIDTHVDDGLRLDHGPGGNYFARISVSGAERLLHFTESTPADSTDNGYPTPAHNTFDECIFETNLNGHSIADLQCGSSNVFNNCLFSANQTAAMSSGYVIRVTNEAAGTLNVCTFNGGIINGGFDGGFALAGAWFFAASARTTISGQFSISWVTDVFSSDGAAIVNVSATIHPGPVPGNRFNALPGGTFLFWNQDRFNAVTWKMPATSASAWVVKREDDDGGSSRLSCNLDGALIWRNGADSTIRAQIQRRTNVDGLLITGETLMQISNYTTALRPNPAALAAGTMIYDTDLSQPLWTDGTVWRDAMGTAV